MKFYFANIVRSQMRSGNFRYGTQKLHTQWYAEPSRLSRRLAAAGALQPLAALWRNLRGGEGGVDCNVIGFIKLLG